MRKWCVLRTSARSTMRLATSLDKDGFSVWTPIEHRRIRIPRANVRREVTLPMMPSYVFADAEHLLDLLAITKLETSAHPSFSVMKRFDQIPVIADHDLEGLRTLERKRTPIRKARQALPLGAEVKIESGSFGGMKGTVERSDHMNTLVCFGDNFVVKIATSLLLADNVGSKEPLAELSVRRAA